MHKDSPNSLFSEMNGLTYYHHRCCIKRARYKDFFIIYCVYQAYGATTLMFLAHAIEFIEVWCSIATNCAFMRSHCKSVDLFHLPFGFGITSERAIDSLIPV